MAHRVLTPPFATLAEWDEWTNSNCPPPRDSDTAVLMGSDGRRATRAQLESYLAEHKARMEREGVELEHE